MTPIIDPPPPPQESKAEIAVRETFREMAEENQRRIAMHQRTFRRAWLSLEYTPAEFFEAAGNQGVRFMQIGGASKNHLAALAAIEGKTLDDYISSEEYDPPVPYTPNPDGTITINPPNP